MCVCISCVMFLFRSGRFGLFGSVVRVWFLVWMSCLMLSGRSGCFPVRFPLGMCDLSAWRIVSVRILFEVCTLSGGGGQPGCFQCLV